MLETLRDSGPDTMTQISEEMSVRKTTEFFLLFAMGSQFDHLIKQNLAKLGVFCLVADAASISAEDVYKLSPTGIILSGGPASVYADTPPFDSRIFDLGMPVLGICLGFQLWTQHIGAQVTGADEREFGRHELTILDAGSPLLRGFAKSPMVLQSHGDRVGQCGKLTVLARTENCPIAAAWYRHLWGVQFHPEVTDTEEGYRIFENFCFGICGAKDRFPSGDVAQEKIGQIRAKIGQEKVLLALSGGSDSSVVCFLLKDAVRAAPGRVRAVYIKGIDRPDDETFVLNLAHTESSWLELVVVDATDAFLEELKGKTTMRDKRMCMREVYKKVLESEARKFGAGFLAQGTLYTDISESGHGYQSGARKAVIKIHHNVNLGFTIPELMPLDDCVKDNARDVGRKIGVPEELLVRHPFPGPGMVVRIEGEVTQERLAIARQADDIFISSLRLASLYNRVWQAGAVVTQSVATHTKGDDAGSGIVVALWAVWSVNGFTATFAELPFDFIRMVSRRITNEVRQVSRVVYAVSDKPPATIEWG